MKSKSPGLLPLTIVEETDKYNAPKVAAGTALTLIGRSNASYLASPNWKPKLRDVEPI